MPACVVKVSPTKTRDGYQFQWRRPSTEPMKGRMRRREKTCASGVSPVSSMALWMAMATAMTSDWPASSPLMPARMLMALVVKTERSSMYSL